MPLIGLACPRCPGEKPLMQVPGRVGVFCEAGHEWRDTEELRASNPKSLSTGLPKPVRKPPDGATELRLLVGGGLFAALNERFGEKLDSSASALLRVMLDPEAFVVVGDDSRRLEQLFGEKVPHADSLIGKVYHLKLDRDEWKTKAEQKAAANQENGAATLPAEQVAGDYVNMQVRLSMEQFNFIFEKAKFNNMTPAKYLQNCIHTGIENQWF